MNDFNVLLVAPLDIQTLQQAQSSDKKHKKLEEEVKNHSVVVDKVVDSGAQLSSSTEYSKVVQENTAKLTESWAELLTTIQVIQMNDLGDDLISCL